MSIVERLGGFWCYKSTNYFPFRKHLGEKSFSRGFLTIVKRQFYKPKTSEIQFLATPFLTQPVLHPIEERCRVIPKEVEIHCDRYFENQIGIERRHLEDFVDMVVRAANLACQPACAALVGFELLTDELPDVDVTIVFHCLLVLGALALFLRAMKMREFIALCRCRLWNAFHTISNYDSRKCMNLYYLFLCGKFSRFTTKGTRAKAQLVFQLVISFPYF